MAEGEPIDWTAFLESIDDAEHFLELLLKLPRNLWAEKYVTGSNLLHVACRGPNVPAVVALLQSGLVDVNARGKLGMTAAHIAAALKQHCVLEMLCAAGADLRAACPSGFTPLDDALSQDICDHGETVHVLVANGVRLSTAHSRYRQYIFPERIAFERGVLRCRAAVVALLSADRIGRLSLREVVLAVWATRYSKEWQN